MMCSLKVRLSRDDFGRLVFLYAEIGKVELLMVYKKAGNLKLLFKLYQLKHCLFLKGEINVKCI